MEFKYGKYDVVQDVSNSHISVFEEGQLVLHAQVIKKMSVDEIKQLVDDLFAICERNVTITEFGKVLYALRRRNNEILADMATKLGVSVSDLSKAHHESYILPNSCKKCLCELYVLEPDEQIAIDKYFDLQ